MRGQRTAIPSHLLIFSRKRRWGAAPFLGVFPQPGSRLALLSVPLYVIPTGKNFGSVLSGHGTFSFHHLQKILRTPVSGHKPLRNKSSCWCFPQRCESSYTAIFANQLLCRSKPAPSTNQLKEMGGMFNAHLTQIGKN